MRVLPRLAIVAAIALIPASLAAQPSNRPSNLPMDEPESRWTHIATLESGTLWLYVEAMTREGSLRLVWERLVLDQPLEDSGVDRVYVLAAYDCGTSRRENRYTIRTAAGRIVSEQAGSTEARPVGPSGMPLLNAACGAP